MQSGIRLRLTVNVTFLSGILLTAGGSNNGRSMWASIAGTCIMLENETFIQDQLITPGCSQVKLNLKITACMQLLHELRPF